MAEQPKSVVMPKKAMILAAGFGTRLQPLTHIVPKPLLPVASVPLIRYSLKLLAKFGIEEVMINLHHLGDQIEAELGRRAENIRIHYSREPQILGTGGGLRKVSNFFDDTFVLINSDAIIDLDLAAAVETHRACAAIATMVLMERPKGCDYSVVGVDAQGYVQRIAERPQYSGPELRPALFTGVHILEPEFLEYIPPDIESCINSYAYPKVIEDQRPVAAHWHEGLWVDVGTLDRYWRINVDILRRRVLPRHFDPLNDFEHVPRKDIEDVIRIGAKCTIGTGVRLEPPVIVANGVRIAEDAEIGPEVIVGEGAVIGKGAKINRAIILPGVKIPAAAIVQNEVLTRKVRVALEPSA